MTGPLDAGPLGAAFVDGLSGKQLLVFESLADDYMIEVLTQVADAYADKMLAEAGRAAALTAADVGDAGDAAAAGAGAVDPAILASVPAAVSESLAATMIPLVAEVYQSSQGKVRAGLIEATHATLPPVHSLDAAAYLRRAPKVFDDIGDQLQANIRAGLAEGFEAGESIPQLAARVRAAAGVTSRKATLIARTSVIDASNVGSMDMAKASGIEMQKEWLATVPTDGRTRPTHIAADGQRVDLHAKFTVGGYECDHPGEYTLPDAEKLGCRCTQGYVVPRAQVMETTEGQAQTEQRLRELRERREGLGGRTRTTVTGLDPERILQAPSPVVSRRLNQDLWGTAQDPAMKMTVTQLREILKNENITYISKANKKQHIVQQLRSWEIDRGRTVLPPMPTDLAAPAITTTTRLGEFTARWDNPDPGELTGGRIPGVAWDGALPSYVDTGPAGIVVRDLELPNSGYVVKHGRAWRIDGTAYLIETPSAVLGVADQAKVLRILDEMRQVHADIPLAEKYNRRYAWVTGRNPADARWSVRYQIPDFQSAATAGGGDVTVWHQSSTGALPGSPQRLIGTLRHETGHNVDHEYAMRRKPPRGSQTNEWEAAGRSDAATGVTAKVKDLKPVSDAGGHPIATTSPDRSKQYPNGVSDYGRAEVGEDFAESYEKYLRGVVGTGELPGTPGTDLYFRDLYPARAAIFDDLFPEFAKAQLAEIKAARAVAAKGGGRVELRAEARARQLDIDKADHAVAALSDVDELVSKRADVGIIEARLQEGITAKAFTKVEADAIRKAVATGDATKIEAALARVAKKRGVTFDGRAGELTTMVDVDAPDAITMRSVSGATIRPGAQVRVVRRGATLTRDGETITLEPMTVREVTPDELAGLRQAVVDERTKVANVAAQIRAELDRGPVSAARVGQITDRNNLSLPARRALVEAAKTPDGLKRAVAAQMKAAEVKASGVVNRGVAFDPETMEVRGARGVGQARPLTPESFDQRLGGARKGQSATAQTEYRFSGNSNQNSDLFPDREERISIMDAFASYRGIGSARLNRKLRAGDLSDGRVARMDQAFARSHLRQDVVVYRGGRGLEFGPKESWSTDLTGREWTDLAYTSTSVDRLKAEPFANDGVLMRIVAPKGTSAVGIRPASRIENPEAEILLARGTKFRVVRDRGFDDQGRRLLDVEVVSDAPNAGAAALDPGTKVKVVETGYVTELDGAPVVLRKAIVEPVAVKLPPTKVAKAAVPKVPPAPAGKPFDTYDPKAIPTADQLRRAAALKPADLVREAKRSPFGGTKSFEAISVDDLQIGTILVTDDGSFILQGGRYGTNDGSSDLWKLDKKALPDGATYDDALRALIKGYQDFLASRSPAGEAAGVAAKLKTLVPDFKLFRGDAAREVKRLRDDVSAALTRQAGLAPKSFESLEGVEFADAGNRAGRDLIDAGAEAVYGQFNQKITLAPKWYQDIYRTLAQNIQAVQRGFNAPSGFDAAGATVSHEFGHHLESRIRRLGAWHDANAGQVFLRELESYLDLPASSLGRGDFAAIEKVMHQNATVIHQRISGYANENFQELVAEVWAEYSSLGEKARPGIWRLGEMLRRISEDGHVSLADIVEPAAIRAARTKIAKKAATKAAVPKVPAKTPGRKVSLVPAKAADAAKQADVARAFAGLAIDVEENAAKGASVKAIQHRVRAALKRLQIEKTPKGYVWHRGGGDMALTGRVTGDIEIDAAQQMADLAADIERLTDQGTTPDQLINAARAHSLARGLEPTTARAGDVVPFDRDAYDMSGARPAAGAPVLIVRPGYTTVINGERIVIEKPLVLSAPGQKLTAKP